uniref:Uncharacterized protein MANES_01G189500 n=1 Tax=Rhizophora mucronata TaxID=61149 RepID=A0A2P2LD72_RHIMU
MAMQTGIGFSRILILAGAGYTGTILVKNGKLSDLLGELQSLVQGIEKSGEQTEGDSDYSDAIAQQVRRLAMEVRQLASSRQITVLNGTSGQMGILLSLYHMIWVSAAECAFSCFGRMQLRILALQANQFSDYF